MGLDKESIIDFILVHKPNLTKEELIRLSLSALVIIKVQIEIETNTKIE